MQNHHKCRRVVVLKGRDFSPAAKGPGFNGALAPEGMIV
jgi:hypothetical protein